MCVESIIVCRSFHALPNSGQRFGGGLMGTIEAQDRFQMCRTLTETPLGFQEGGQLHSYLDLRRVGLQYALVFESGAIRPAERRQ